jgi:hypothetical protein
MYCLCRRQQKCRAAEPRAELDVAEHQNSNQLCSVRTIYVIKKSSIMRQTAAFEIAPRRSTSGCDNEKRMSAIAVILEIFHRVRRHIEAVPAGNKTIDRCVAIQTMRSISASTITWWRASKSRGWPPGAVLFSFLNRNSIHPADRFNIPAKNFV